MGGGYGFLVLGELLTGVIRGGSTLQSEHTGRPVRVLGVEFAAPMNEGTNKVTLRIERNDARAIKPGTTLISHPDHPADTTKERVIMTDAESERREPEVMDPAETEEYHRRYDISAEEVAEVLKRRHEEEVARTRELFGDQEPFPYPDLDADS